MATGILGAIVALLQLAPLILKIFMKTDAEKLLIQKQAFIDYLTAMDNAISKAEKKIGDTKDIEDEINKRLP